MRRSLIVVLMALVAILVGACLIQADRVTFPLPPHFIKYEGNPILRPTGRGFDAERVYNPAVIIVDGVFYMLYRAEGEGTGTGAIGLAKSEDGIHFTRHPEPVIVPEYDFEKKGGEDPRLVRIEDVYYLTYNGNDGRERPTPGNVCLAISRDLLHWEKKGEILQPKPGAWNSGQIKAGAIVPEKVAGKYVMYFQGEIEPWKTRVGIAYSDDLLHWYEPLDKPVMVPRPGRWDSWGTEPGVAVVIDEGILLIYNGWDETKTHRVGWALFSKDDPTKLLARSEEPILEPIEEWEGHIFFAEGLAYKDGIWYLYYGIMDRWIGIAMYRVSGGSH
jgi:predicted GH43/DUF377 family glycosyl hydrolase